MLRLVLLGIALLVACDGDAFSPRAERERAAARKAAALSAHLEAMPGVDRASVVLEAPAVDPLAPRGPAPPPRASVVLALEPGAAVDAPAVQRVVAASVDGLDPANVTVLATAPPAPAARTVAVGPFRVEEGSRAPLVAALAAALALIAGLAAWIAVWGLRARRRA